MKRKGNIVLTVLAVLVIEGIVMIMGSHDFLKDSKDTQYQLEKEVSQKYFSSIWEEFTTEQRTKTINALNAKRSWGIKDLKDLGELGKNAYALVKDPKTLYSLGKNMWNLLPGILGYSFAEKDAVCMFIMTVSMIKSK